MFSINRKMYYLEINLNLQVISVKNVDESRVNLLCLNESRDITQQRMNNFLMLSQLNDVKNLQW